MKKPFSTIELVCLLPEPFSENPAGGWPADAPRVAGRCAGCSCMRSARRLQRYSRVLKQGDDCVAALDAVRAEEDRLA